MRGYLFAITNPKLSGVAIAHFAHSIEAMAAPTPENVTRVPVDAGHGVRVLVGMFKDAGLYPIVVDEHLPPVEYTLDEFGVLATARIVGR